MREVSKQLIKAKPAFHKATFLKPVHRTAEFCSTCHKVHIPGALNDYKEFLRGQNHYDSFILSGVSGRGARSFYYPPKAEGRCAETRHMPLRTSGDFGAQPFDDSGALQIHDHAFIAANTGGAGTCAAMPTRSRPSRRSSTRSSPSTSSACVRAAPCRGG